MKWHQPGAPPPQRCPTVPLLLFPLLYPLAAMPLQDKGCARYASQVLSALAYLAPDLVVVS